MLDGLVAVLKHLPLSRSVIAALLVTSATMIFGPKYFGAMPLLDGDLLKVAWLTMIFSAFLCGVWLVLGAARGGKFVLSILWEVLFPLKSENLTSDERIVLGLAARDQLVAMREAEFYAGFSVPFVVRLSVNNLRRRGLVGLTSTDHFYLTDRGRKFCLDNFHQESED